ncbi:hypothetical protein ACFPYN_02910 [Paenisporosarcina macmurdoensis]|uniref:Uncharacterized protein n=1 Tax=Paenisporosarcina macmurdoensis TaxID=212659 RepID=A0ABW1L5J2_9BACL
MERTKLIQEIIFLAMLVQENTGHCVFVNFSGHVESMDISIRKSKMDYCEHICDSSISLKRGNVMKRLQEVKDTLSTFLEAREVDTTLLRYEIEEVRHYKF